ncbi:MAG: EthD family reductase [Streptosporangiaceae bacterium]
MLEIAALLNVAQSGEPAAAVPSLVDRLKSEPPPTDWQTFTMRGLVVSEVLKYLTEPNDVRALVQVWAEGSEDGSEVLESLLSGTGWSDAAVDAWQVREHVFRQPVERQSPGASPHGVKLAGTAYRRDDFTPEAFFDYWRNVHAPISGSVPGVGGYVVSEVRGQLSGKLAPDALLELWWPDEQTFEASGPTPEQAAAWEDVQRYAKTTGTFWLMRESVLVPPPPTGPGSLEVSDA